MDDDGAGHPDAVAVFAIAADASYGQDGAVKPEPPPAPPSEEERSLANVVDKLTGERNQIDAACLVIPRNVDVQVERKVGRVRISETAGRRFVERLGRMLP